MALSASSADLELANRLNSRCFCVTLDERALRDALQRESGDPDFFERFIAPRPHLFSTGPVFLGEAGVHEMLRIVRAIEATTRLERYRRAVFAWAPEIAQPDFGPRGAMMGYDFHLGPNGPKLIEINTNAGGAFLNALLAKAQHACCAEMAAPLGPEAGGGFEAGVVAMFAGEWARQRGGGVPARLAIVDDRPDTQYLYPEFLLAQRVFRRHGVEAIVADAGALDYTGGRLTAGGQAIDLVYNRLTDFSLSAPEHAALRAAYRDQAVVVTPNPHIHALFADKRNLALLSDRDALLEFGLPAEARADLADGVPRTVEVAEANAAALWARRKALFFKPATGYGSKAVYRGDKVTKGVWAEIARGGYVAQDFVAPGERTVEIDGVRVPRKVDVRLYTYDGRLLLAAARLYQGQATNFRTEGGGFAPVFVV